MQSNVQWMRLFRELKDDVGSPAFLWQLSALLLALALAWGIQRWWRMRSEQIIAKRIPSLDENPDPEHRGRVFLTAASSRLVFPLVGMVLTWSAKTIQDNYFATPLLNIAVSLLGAMALVRFVVFVLRRSFPRATWLEMWEKTIAFGVWTWVALYMTDLQPWVIKGLKNVVFSVGSQKLDLWMILSAVVTVFLMMVFALWFSNLVENRVMRMSTLDSNIRMVFVRILKTALLVVAVLMSLSLVGINMTALSVFTGALGVGLGFGLQKIASNYVAGFILLLDRSIRIGNLVQVGNDIGVVSKITTRYTVLANPGGVEYIVPNETLIGSTVQNQTYSTNTMRLATTVGVAYDTNLDLAMSILARCATVHERVLEEPPPRVLLREFGDSAILLELGFWVVDPDKGKGGVVSDVNMAIWREFKKHGISIPFPQREIRILPS